MFVWFAIFCCLSFFLAACGPERSGASSEEELSAETIRIAREYAADGDLTRARVQLQELDVANSTQWLIYLTETNVKNSTDPETTGALVQLTIGLGIQSAPVLAYAREIGLIQEPQANPQPAMVDAGASSADTPAVVAAADQAVDVADNASDRDQDSSGETNNSGETDNGEAAADAPGNAAAEPATANVVTENVVAEEATGDAKAEGETAAAETPVTDPTVTASTSMNVRGGPGTVYPVVGVLDSGVQAEIIARNPEQDWWQVLLSTGQEGWVYGPLVQTAGDTSTIAVAANIPEPPPPPTPAPIVEAPPPAAEEPAAEQPAAEEPAVEEPAVEEPAAEQPAPSGPHFTLVEKRLWDVYENGGRLDGPTVICGEKHELFVDVIDANGNRLNGIAVQSIYTGETFVTGDQGKGDGTVEYILWGTGQGVKIVRDVDGREATSDVADGMTPQSPNIPEADLIAAGYCTDTASCNRFNKSAGCWGHHSWTVKFQRNY